MLHIGIVAGEASGDYLGAELIQAIQAINPDLTVNQKIYLPVILR